MNKNFGVEHGQKSMCPLLSQNPKIDWSQERIDELIFCMLLQIQENWKLLQWFLGGHGHLVHETLKSSVLWEWVYELSWFFLHTDYDARIFG